MGEEEKTSVRVLKNSLFDTPILVFSKEVNPLTMETDACDKQVGSVFLQPQKSDWMDL